MRSQKKKASLRARIRESLPEIAAQINKALSGNASALRRIEPVLRRIGRGGSIPHWYEQLRQEGVLPNLDGKTVGSVVEMLLVGVLETSTLLEHHSQPLRINPARGVDLPDLDLGVKSPSENFCTSEPFFSAYDRLLGTEFDLVVLLTDYQTAKKNPPLRLQIIQSRYLGKTQVADQNLCRLARLHREWLLKESDATAQKLFRFLAYVNQSDWRARHILRMIGCMRDDDAVRAAVQFAKVDFDRQNRRALEKDKLPIPEVELESVLRVETVSPTYVAVLEAAENWVLDSLKDAARAPSTHEWERLKTSPLDGAIGMSFALQWRYNFQRLFQLKD